MLLKNALFALLIQVLLVGLIDEGKNEFLLFQNRLGIED
jgi:hypothetical protein